ncbi:hypothetical protein AgCh_018159 [Apium graveolens]
MPRRFLRGSQGKVPAPFVSGSSEVVVFRPDKTPGLRPSQLVSELQNVNPPELKGEPNPVAVGAWLKKMEKAFNLVQVRENLRTDYGSYFLKNEANYWWESTRALEGEYPVPWARFTELFLEKYFPDCVNNQMEIEFLEPKQGDGGVAEYEAKFTELARFVPDYVCSEAQKARRFQQGLKPEIRSGVVALQLKTYPSVVQAALVIEFDQKLAAKEREDKKRKIDDVEEVIGQEESSQKSHEKVGRSKNKEFREKSISLNRISNTSASSNQANSVKSPILEYKQCGKMHDGRCKVNTECFRCSQKGHYTSECKVENPRVVCYNCGKVGHVAKNCRSTSRDSIGGFYLHFGGGIIKNKPWHVFSIARGKKRADYGEETEQNHFFPVEV